MALFGEFDYKLHLDGWWKDVTTGHESIGPNLILLKTEVKNYVATSGLI